MNFATKKKMNNYNTPNFHHNVNPYYQTYYLNNMLPVSYYQNSVNQQNIPYNYQTNQYNPNYYQNSVNQQNMAYNYQYNPY